MASSGPAAAFLSAVRGSLTGSLIIICMKVQVSLTSLHNVSVGQSTCVQKAPEQIYIFFITLHHTFIFLLSLFFAFSVSYMQELSKLSWLWCSYSFLCVVVNMNFSKELVNVETDKYSKAVYSKSCFAFFFLSRSGHDQIQSRN